jgi:hypothetical protein
VNKFLNRFTKDSLLALTLLAAVALIMPAGAVAGPDCDRHPEHPSCGGDGGGGGDGGPSARYTAALTMGGFRFNAVEVTINNRENGFSSTLPLDMGRPVTTSPPVGQIAWEPGDDFMWDEVFLACSSVLGNVQITGVSVGTDWGITQGGKKNSNTSTNIRITFRDVVADGFPEVDIDFALITWAFFDRSDFLPALGATSVYPLDTAKIYGSDINNHLSCNSGEFKLSKSAILEMSRIE